MMNYKTGSKKIAVPEQAKIVDPKSEKSFRGKGVYIATGDEVTVKGTGKARKQTAKWY